MSAASYAWRHLRFRLAVAAFRCGTQRRYSGSDWHANYKPAAATLQAWEPDWAPIIELMQARWAQRGPSRLQPSGSQKEELPTAPWKAAWPWNSLRRYLIPKQALSEPSKNLRLQR